MLLLEHQSWADPLMQLRLLGYMVRIWEEHVQRHGGTMLPAILPVVVHHSEHGWKRSVEMSAMYDLTPEALDVLRPLLPSFRCVLDDISHASDADLRQRAMDDAFVGTLLYCYRHRARPERILGGLLGWVDVVQAILRAPDGVAALVAIVTYVSKVSDRKEWVADQLRTLLAPAHKEDIVATIYEQLLAEGRAEQRGKEARAMLSRLLTVKLGTVGDDVTARIALADVETVERWAEQLMTARTIEDALRGR